MKKGQVWGADLIIATIIFSLGIMSLYLFTINSPQNSQEKLENLIYEGDLIADSIISTGAPDEWNASNVFQIGILSNGKINETKLESFYDLSITDYSRTKYLFNTNYQYLFNLSEAIFIDSQPIVGIGNLSVPLDNEQVELIKITRFTIYNNKPVTAYVYVWSENE